MTNQLVGNGHRWGKRIAVDIPVEVAAPASPAIHGVRNRQKLGDPGKTNSAVNIIS